MAVQDHSGVPIFILQDTDFQLLESSNRKLIIKTVPGKPSLIQNKFGRYPGRFTEPLGRFNRYF